jgi:hypothetical protein
VKLHCNRPRNRFAIALCNRFANALQSLWNRFTIALQSLCNRSAIALRSFCTSKAGKVYQIIIPYHSLCVILLFFIRAEKLAKERFYAKQKEKRHRKELEEEEKRNSSGSLNGDGVSSGSINSNSDSDSDSDSDGGIDFDIDSDGNSGGSSSSSSSSSSSKGGSSSSTSKDGSEFISSITSSSSSEKEKGKEKYPPGSGISAQDKLPLVFPPPALCTDNGVMAAWAGIEKLTLGISNEWVPEPDPAALVPDVVARWPLGDPVFPFADHPANAKGKNRKKKKAKIAVVQRKVE